MMRKLATGMALALVCMPAIGEAGFYTGIGVGKVRIENEIEGADLEGSDTGFKLFGGYRFNEYGSIEAAYIDAGTPDDTVGGVNIETDASAFQASAIWQIPIGARFEAYVRGSVIAWEAETSARSGGFNLNVNDDGSDFGYGIGIAAHITPKFGLRAEFEGAELDGVDMQFLSVGGLIRF